MAQPAKSLESIYKKLNELLRQPKDRVAFELQRLKQEAKKQISVDPAEAHTLLGAIACLERNLDKVREHHRIASQLLPSEPMVYSNFAYSLSNLGQYAEAAEQSETASNLQPENISYLKSAIKNNFFGGNIDRASDLCNQLDIRAPDNGWSLCDYLRDYFLPAYEELQLSPNIVKSYLDSCASLLRERRLMAVEVQWIVDRPNGEEPTLAYEVKVDAPVDELVKLNLDVQERTFDTEDFASTNEMCVVFRYAELNLAETFSRREGEAS